MAASSSPPAIACTSCAGGCVVHNLPLNYIDGIAGFDTSSSRGVVIHPGAANAVKGLWRVVNSRLPVPNPDFDIAIYQIRPAAGKETSRFNDAGKCRC
jgi:hypothetical protein